MHEELFKRLREAGVPTDGSWGASKTQEIKSPLLEKQKSNLLKLKEVLELQIQKDKAQVAELQSNLEKLKRGGGR